VATTGRPAAAAFTRAIGLARSVRPLCARAALPAARRDVFVRADARRADSLAFLPVLPPLMTVRRSVVVVVVVVVVVLLVIL
jgi:hypothetical protein